MQYNAGEDLLTTLSKRCEQSKEDADKKKKKKNQKKDKEKDEKRGSKSKSKIMLTQAVRGKSDE